MTSLANLSMKGTREEPGLCSASVYLDKKSSGVDDFYKGARIEMTSKDSMTAWWADIEEYDGFTKLAMFKKWNKPFGRETDPEAVPKEGDTYRIFLLDSMRGMCRDPKNLVNLFRIFTSVSVLCLCELYVRALCVRSCL